MKLPLDVLGELQTLSRLPYENLSKIALLHRRGSVEDALLQEEIRAFRGGTCFALTYSLHMRLKALGYTTGFLMADKLRYANVHCGLLWEWEGARYLLDPGYLIYAALPLPESGLSHCQWIPPNEVVLTHIPDQEVWRLSSGKKGSPVHRFDFRRMPVSEAEFMRHWQDSYFLEMMDYPVLNKAEKGVQYYLQKRNLIIRTEIGSEMRRLDRAGVERAAVEIFGLNREMTEAALNVLSDRNQNLFKD